MLTSGGSSPFPSPGLHVCCSSAAGVLCWRSGAARAVCGRGESCTEAASSDEQTRSSSGERRVYVRPRRRALREPGLGGQVPMGVEAERLSECREEGIGPLGEVVSNVGANLGFIAGAELWLW
mmetsp:Transcript_8156/g.30095  ORF Transcript_8156/g.30095 Transcript_8156/m.30095 type:complete len:123 (+) Transcript_8156:490-858(+)